MTTVLLIRNWAEHFETPESEKRLHRAYWVPFPNKQDGRGYKRIMAESDGRTIYGTWCPTVQMASKMPVRGLLADRDGPLSSDDIATKISATAQEVDRMIALLTEPKIGWLQKAEWDPHASFDENVAGLRQSGYIRGRPVRRSSGLTKIHHSESVPRQSDNSEPVIESSVLTESRHVRAVSTVQDSTAQEKKVQIPLPSPLKGRQPADDLITSVDEAKRLICEKILGGKNPDRPWSHDAAERLAELCRPPGLPRIEIERISWFRSLPKAEDVPELKARRDPITETGLMNYWGDEFSRANAYWEKTHPQREKRLEPPQWQEFFRWFYRPSVTLPKTFYDLPADLQVEYEKGFKQFIAATAK